MNQTEDLLDLLSEAAVEIANLDSRENPVCQRVRLALKARYEAHRKRCEQECTRDVIFLFQSRSWQLTGYPDGIDHDGECFIVADWPDREPLHGPTPMWTEWPAECPDVDEWLRSFVDGNGVLHPTTEFWAEAARCEGHMGWPLAHEEWRTQSVWLDRQEAEAHGKAKSHRYPDGWRVYGVCAEGDLAKMLTGDAAASAEDGLEVGRVA